MHKYCTLTAWQKAHQIAKLALIETDRRYYPRSRALFDQIRRAAISVEANIVEGYALGTAPLFRRHLRIAVGSAAEVECLVRLAGEVGYLNGATVSELGGLLNDVIGVLHGLLRARLIPGG
jgi:four helix bundle protein